MKKVIIITILLNLTFVFSIFVKKVNAFEPEAALQVSKGISEWKLMNKDKSEAQVGPTVYVSSSLSEMVEKGSSEGVGLVNGLSAYIYQEQIPDPILRQDADLLNTIYQGNIKIVRDTTLPWAGAWDVTTRTIKINPAQFSNPIYGPRGTDLGRVLAHEMDHAKMDGFSIIATGQPVNRGYPSVILLEDYAIRADRNFETALHNRFSVEKTIAQSMKIMNYNPFETYRISETNALGNILEMGKNNPIMGAESRYSSIGTGIGKWNAGTGNISPLPSMPSTINYPPPEILFSTKNPLNTYTPSMPRIPTYNPPRIPSSLGRNY